MGTGSAGATDARGEERATAETRPGPDGGRRGERRVAAAVLVAAVVFAGHLAWLPRRLDRLVLTGDEPHYLMTAISLVEDGDVDETNNYANKDYLRLGHQLLKPHATKATRAGTYSKHGLGLPVLIVLPYAVGGRTAVLVFLALVAAGVAANATLLAAAFTPSLRLAAAVALALSLSSPLAALALLVFPELPAALCIVYATRRLLAPWNAPWQWALVGGCAAALPWLHLRFALVSLMLAVVALVRRGRRLRGRDGLAALALPVASAVALAGWYVYLYGRPLPATGDYEGFAGVAGFLNGLAGLAFDQQWGALLYNPLLVLALATCLPFARDRRSEAAALAAIAVPYVLLLADFRVWWGGLSPPARFLTSVVPLAPPPLAWWLGRLPVRWRRPVLAAFAAPALAIMAMLVAEPTRLYTYVGGTALLFDAWDRWTGLR